MKKGQHLDIDMLKTGNITFSKTSAYQKDEYYRIEERTDGDNFHEMKYQIYKELHIDILSNIYKIVYKKLKCLERHSTTKN